MRYSCYSFRTFVIAADIILKIRRFGDLVHDVLKLNTDKIKALNLNIS